MPIPFAAISAGLGLVDSTVGFFQSQKQQKDAKKALDEFKRQELFNPARDIRLSTLKADQQTEANVSNMATSVDALQRTGARGVLGGLPSLSEQNILVQNSISQDLENQDVNRSYQIAEGEERLRAIREQREAGAILGLGNQLQTGRQDQATSTTNLASSLLSFGDALYRTNTSEDSETKGFTGTFGSNSSFLTGASRRLTD